ncbi:sensor histidine kinase [Brevibacillus centrosporus]|uniref:sensor histidine kinase n=1 Tax=Brevibacillus centrosporus TaxID=54910 RepID=UPI001FE61E16|nr:HAMP domain-containing sensor histidine kinase [Brevibacillus centrosporus]MEC2129835.1 HAMP domain-containing sensor histidine kinase [Brevibacillus centrosporus]MED4907131.1 HAMP domain-containing sensor histidine kinase [Brevibacillus centrosporus]
MSLIFASSRSGDLVIVWRCVRIKSLYTRVVLVFIFIVMLSLFAAFLISTWMFEGRTHHFIEETLAKDAKNIIEAYQSNSSAELGSFVQGFSGLSIYTIQLYNKEGVPQLEEKEPIHVEQSQIQQVLGGDIARSLDAETHGLPIVGVPLSVKGDPYALFLTLDKNTVEQEQENMPWIHALYILVLLIGSFLILIAARYVVNPIMQLTEATKRMAKGTFDSASLPMNRRDEIGQLSVSFHEMAKELAKLDQMRQDFVSSVSHEIQSPLTSISGFTKALKQKKMSEETRLRYLTIIEEESERLSRLGQNLLQLSYLQQEQHPLKVTTYQLDEQLRRAVITLEPLWTVKEINMVVDLEAITVHADKDQLDQVWINLLNNAIKFTAPHGTIRIQSMGKAQQNIVSITDSGIGIPQEELADIFKPFHKVDKARSSSVKGNGLGLSIVKQIIEMHNGEIHVSSSLGAGTIFTVALPREN